MSWIQKVIDANEDSEAPESFFYWSSLATIAAVVGRNVWLDKFKYILYPNIYVVLTAKSGMRKGLPVALAKSMVEEVGNTKVVAGRNSIEGVLMVLSRAKTTEGGLVLGTASGFMVSGELSTFLLRNLQALDILTDLYDTHYHEKEWANTLKGSPIERLKMPCLTLLSASNAAHLSNVLEKKDIEGGFIARTFMIHSSKSTVINDLLDEPKLMVKAKDLAPYLMEISKVKGPFKIDNNAKLIYRKWYKSLREDIMSGEGVNDSTGTIERIHDHVLKVAMGLSLSEKLDLVILEKEMQESMDKCSIFVSGARKISMGVGGESDLGVLTKDVLIELIKSKDYQLTRMKLLQRVWNYGMDYIILDRIIETLMQANAIKTFREGKDVIYRMTDYAIEQYTESEKKLW